MWLIRGGIYELHPGQIYVFCALAGVRVKVHEGVPIATPLIENPVFPPMVSQMVKIGEETGELEKMLTKIADFYEDDPEFGAGRVKRLGFVT